MRILNLFFIHLSLINNVVKHRISKIFNEISTNFNKLVLFVVALFKHYILPRLILTLCIPIFLMDALFAVVILIKNWSIKHTKELDV